MVDSVGVEHDHAAFILPENIGQADGGNHVAVENIPQHVACAYAGKLVCIPHEDDPGSGEHSAHQTTHQNGVNHTHFFALRIATRLRNYCFNLNTFGFDSGIWQVIDIPCSPYKYATT
jgi:hypothetical protein